MRKRIFEKDFQCPCLVREELAASANVYKFLARFYDNLDDKSWEQFNIVDLECAYCLLKKAIKLIDEDKKSCTLENYDILQKSKNNVAENLLDTLLDRLEALIEK